MRARREKINWREKAFIAIAAASMVFAAIVLLSPEKSDLAKIEIATLEDLSTSGFAVVKPAAEVVGGQGVVALTGGCYSMVAGTDATQAESISNALSGVAGERPNTHDVVRDMLESLGIELVMVKVTELRGNNFHGRIILRQGDTILNLDSRPSDGIALALRTNSTIYFNETLLKERGQKIC
jgi:bifunctional DNase/RNase